MIMQVQPPFQHVPVQPQRDSVKTSTSGHWRFPWGTPIAGWLWKIPLKGMIWGYPYFRKPPLCTEALERFGKSWPLAMSRSLSARATFRSRRTRFSSSADFIPIFSGRMESRFTIIKSSHALQRAPIDLWFTFHIFQILLVIPKDWNPFGSSWPQCAWQTTEKEGQNMPKYLTGAILGIKGTLWHGRFC